MTSGSSGRTTVTVAARGAADFRTIGAAVEAAPLGALILVAAGDYVEKLTISRDVEINAQRDPGSVRLVFPSGPVTITAGAVVLRGLNLWQGELSQSGLGRLVGRSADDEPAPAQMVNPTAGAVHVRGGQVRIDGCSISARTGLGVGVFGQGTSLEISNTRFWRVTGGMCVLNGAQAFLDACEFSEWALDALWVSRPGSRLEVRHSAFRTGTGQGAFIDFGGTAIIEDNEFEEMGAGIFVDRADTEALIARNRISRCTRMAVGITGGARAALEGNVVSGSTIGLQVMGAGSAIEAVDDSFADNEVSVGLVEGARALVSRATIRGGERGVVVGGTGSHLELRDSVVSAAGEAAAKARAGGSLQMEGGELRDSKFGLLAESAGTVVNLRAVEVSGNSGPGISIGAGVNGTVESCDIHDNAFPGVVAVGGTARVFDNRVHDNRSNGIAIRDKGDGLLEGNEVWANDLPAITVVGRGTHGRVRDNNVHDNLQQGIFVFDGASAEVVGNQAVANIGPAIAASDAGTTAVIERNRVSGGGTTGIWLADGATAQILGNQVDGTAAAGIFISSQAHAEVTDNAVTGAPIGIFVDRAGGSFVGNRLRGNFAGSWCLRSPVGVTLDGNDDEALDVPAWAAAELDPALYPIFAFRIGLELGIPPRDVAALGSAMSLPALARRLGSEEVVGWSEIVRAHLATERHGSASAQELLAGASPDEAAIRAGLRAHLELAALATGTRPSRPTMIPGVVEVLSVQGPEQVGVPLASPAGLGAVDDLFERGERNARDLLRVTPFVLDGLHVFAIEGSYSGSAALLHLAEWCPEVIGSYGTLVLAGDAENLVAIPVEDTSIIYALPSIVGIAAGGWAKAAWKLRPVVVWLSHDRSDLIEIDVRPDESIARVNAPANLAALLGRLPEPTDRLPLGWEGDGGLSHEEATRLLPIVRLELLARMGDDLAALPVLSPRVLVDVATVVRPLPPDRWPAAIHDHFDAIALEREELDRLSGGAPYSEVKRHLWIQLDRTDGAGSGGIKRPVAGLTASIVFHGSGARKRFVARTLVPRWGVTEADLWAAAEANMLDGELVATNPAGPVVRYGMADHECEAIGLVLHRLPGACPNGYLVGIVHKGAAYAIPLADRESIRSTGSFGSFIADMYPRAAAFHDELSSEVFWLHPDGTIETLFDALGAMPASPPAQFRELAARLGALD